MSMQLFVVDRGRNRSLLAELVPGAIHVPLGSHRHDAATINPWDVDDPTDVAASKIDFLVRLQALLLAARDPGPRPFAPTALERSLLAIAVRDVYARAGDSEGVPSQGFMQAVLTDLARQERADPHGSVARAAGYAGLASRLHDVCATGRFGHLFDRPTRLPAAGAPLVVLGTASVPPEVAAAVLLSIAEYVQRLAERLPAGRVALLVDALDVAPLHGDAERFPEPFPHDSLLNGLHESYLSRRVRAGEIHAIAYLHAISDVARFLHPPTALGAGPPPD